MHICINIIIMYISLKKCNKKGVSFLRLLFLFKSNKHIWKSRLRLTPEGGVFQRCTLCLKNGESLTSKAVRVSPLHR